MKENKAEKEPQNIIKTRSSLIFALTVVLVFTIGCLLPIQKWKITWFPVLFIFLIVFFSVISLVDGIRSLKKNVDFSAIVGICISLFFLFGFLVLPFINFDKEYNREKLQRIYCSSNLKKIGTALKQYALDNQGFFPDGNNVEAFSKLLTGKYLTDPEFLACPAATVRLKNAAVSPSHISLSSNDVSYLYLGSGLNEDDLPDKIIVCDKEGNHKKSCNLLFLDGQVQNHPNTNFDYNRIKLK